MYLLRPLGIGDVVRALRRRRPRAALCIARCVVSNGVNAVRFQLHRRVRSFPYRIVRRAP